MNGSFIYIIKNNWPLLAWLAICSKDTPEIRIHHGKGVEVKEAWFCEAVWDGSFEEGGFDQTDLIFGSGGRLRDGVPVFVSSGATCDRLQFFRKGDRTYISNSLACIKAFSTGWPDPGFSRYRHFFLSITEGINRYERVVPQNGPTLAYYHNLTWDGVNIDFCEKPWSERRFSSFETYESFLKETLEQIGLNLSDSSRRFKLTPIGAISSGYDSAASSALARCAGLKEVFTFGAARGDLKDDGCDIAAHLGLQVTLFDRRSWHSEPFVEAPFFAADGEGGELSYNAASDVLKSRVLFTGDYGDRVWDKHTQYGGNPEILGGGYGGGSLTEYRLILGTIHVPVPYIGVRNIAEINVISQSPDMEPWDIGGDYNRPICRRILEEAGVPRELFGQDKKAIATLFRRGDVLLTRSTRLALIKWFQVNLKGFTDLQSKRLISKNIFISHSFFPEIWFSIEKSIRRLIKMVPQSVAEGMSWRLYKIRKQVFLSANFLEPYIFPWAVDVISGLYKPNSGTDDSV